MILRCSSLDLSEHHVALEFGGQNDIIFGKSKACFVFSETTCWPLTISDASLENFIKPTVR